MNRLANKTALITGGSSGIGLAVATKFVAEGADVFITGRDESQLKDAARTIGTRAVPIVCDVSNLADLDRLISSIQTHTEHPLDVVVANAGVGSTSPLNEITEHHYVQMSDINIKGTIFTVQKALPLLRRGSSVILLSSTAASRSAPSMSVYGATKAAIRSFARSWAAELADSGIRVNSISPGPIETAGIYSLAGSGQTRADFKDAFAARVPLNRLGVPEEVAFAAVYLASDEALFSTGTELFVDGGLAQL